MTFRKSLLALALASLASLATLAPAQAGPAEERVRAAIAQNTKGRVQPDQVFPSPIPGVFEVVTKGEVFYADATGRYGFVEGRLVDLVSERDLTAQRIDAINRVDFKQLPLHLAVKVVRGDGRRHLAVFEDPGCPACRSLHKFIAQLPDVTVYHFMYPVTDPASVNKARAAWCSTDPRSAWLGLMQGGGIAPAQPGCDVDGLQQIITLGDQLNLVGTPVVFLANGRRLVGLTPPEQFLAALDEPVLARR